MGATWTRRPGAVLAVWIVTATAGADELPPLPAPPARSDQPPAIRVDAGPARPEPAGAPAPRVPVTPPGGAEVPDRPTPALDADVAAADPAAARIEARERLKALPAGNDKSADAAARALRQVLEERVAWLDAWDQAVKERRAGENPSPSPEKLAAEAKAELERVKAILDRSAQDADVLMPASFRTNAEDVPESVRTEMKEAIDAAQAELKERSSRLEQVRSEQAKKPGAALAALRAARDKAFQRVAAVKARNLDRAAAAAEAKTPEARAVAREQRVNAAWEARVEAERLKAQEALLTLEARRAELPALDTQVLEAQVQLARKTLERMKARYARLAERRESDLHRAAAAEQTRAATTGDPLERYRARRAGELLELEARVLRSENALTANPRPSFEEQRALADRAETDFTGVKHLLDDGKVSHLDALRLNNDFRRIGAQRTRIVRSELAAAAQRLTDAENALSAVEMELIYDSRDDRYELDNLLERLPPASHARAVALFDDFEARRSALLLRRRAALEKLAAKAEQTHEQVLRRLRILDDHFGFIRTNLFWVRDEEPVGAATLQQARRELRQLARESVRIAAEVGDRSLWGRVSPEFLAALLGLVVLPWPLHRLRGFLKAVGRAPRPARPAVAP